MHVSKCVQSIHTHNPHNKTRRNSHVTHTHTAIHRWKLERLEEITLGKMLDPSRHLLNVHR